MTTTAHPQLTDRMRRDLAHAATHNQGHYSYGIDHPSQTGATGAGLVRRGLVAYARATYTRIGDGPRRVRTSQGFYLTPAGWAAAGVDRPADEGRLTLADALTEAYPAPAAAGKPLTFGMISALNEFAQNNQGWVGPHLGPYATNYSYRTGNALHDRGLIVRLKRSPVDGYVGCGWTLAKGYYLTPAGWDAVGIGRPADTGRLTEAEALAEAYPVVDADQLLPSRTALNEAVAAFEAEPATPAAATHWEFREGAEARYTDPDGDTLRIYASDADTSIDYVIIAADGPDASAIPVFIRVAAPGPDGLTPLDDVDHLIDALRAAKRAALAARAARDQDDSESVLNEMHASPSAADIQVMNERINACDAASLRLPRRA